MCHIFSLPTLKSYSMLVSSPLPSGTRRKKKNIVIYFTIFLSLYLSNLSERKSGEFKGVPHKGIGDQVYGFVVVLLLLWDWSYRFGKALLPKSCCIHKVLFQLPLPHLYEATRSNCQSWMSSLYGLYWGPLLISLIRSVSFHDKLSLGQDES